MRICHKCSRTFDDSWVVCLYCRATLEHKEGRNGEPPSEDPPTHGPNAVIIIFCVILVLFGLMYLLFWGLCGGFRR